MPLFQRLYNAVWLAFFCCVLVPRWMGLTVGAPVHVLLGFLALFTTWGNARRLAALAVPARLKRVSKVAFKFCVFQAACGLALGAVVIHLPGVPIVGSALRAAHVVAALAMLAQLSSVATGYDMWEEKELQEAPAATPASSPAPQSEAP